MVNVDNIPKSYLFGFLRKNGIPHKVVENFPLLGYDLASSKYKKKNGGGVGRGGVMSMTKFPDIAWCEKDSK